MAKFGESLFTNEKLCPGVMIDQIGAKDCILPVIYGGQNDTSWPIILACSHPKRL